MSKKHYIAIAQLFNDELSRAPEARESLERLAENFAYIARSDNYRFDRARFLTACGLDES